MAPKVDLILSLDILFLGTSIWLKPHVFVSTLNLNEYHKIRYLALHRKDIPKADGTTSSEESTQGRMKKLIEAMEGFREVTLVEGIDHWIDRQKCNIPGVWLTKKVEGYDDIKLYDVYHHNSVTVHSLPT